MFGFFCLKQATLKHLNTSLLSLISKTFILYFFLKITYSFSPKTLHLQNNKKA